MSINCFSLNTSVGELSATLNHPADASHILLLAHGAGADHTHAHMSSLAEAFAAQKIATLRFNFPFKQEGRNRVDSKSISISAIADAAAEIQNIVQLPLLAGGHSFGGRMATHAVAENQLTCKAIILCSFPLHGAGKPSTQRAAHLKDISVPMLFLSGTRDALADRSLLEQEIDKLSGGQSIHWLDTADHSFKILKRTRKSGIDVYSEAAVAAREFIDNL